MKTSFGNNKGEPMKSLLGTDVVLFVCALALLQACGGKSQGSAKVGSATGSASGQPSSGLKPGRDTVDVKFSLAEKSMGLASMSLATPTSFVVDILGCDSGFSKLNHSIADGSGTVTFYKDDTNCRVELKQFSYDSKSYSKEGGGSLADGSATFVDPAASSKLMVTVATKLPSPITASSSVSYQFYGISAGGSGTLSNYSSSNNLEMKGVASPNFSLEQSELSSLESGTGVGIFSIKMQCGKAVVNNSCESAGGDVQAFSSMHAKLIANDAAQYPGGALTYAQAAAVMASGAVQVPSVTDTSTANGGFVVSLKGPGKINENKSMILVLSYGNATGTSYKYYSVDIGDL